MGLEWFQYYTAWNDFANQQRYDAPAPPWKMRRVNPLDVEFFSVISMKWGLGRVRGGEWDERSNLTSLSEIAAYSGFRQRFENGAN